MGHHLLIVDDDPGIRETLELYLGCRGYTISTACDGVEMRGRLAAEPIDLIILDLILPEENGFDLLRELRQTSQIPVILLTGRGEETSRIVGLEIGADDYIPKPFSAGELAARIGAVLRRAVRAEAPVEGAPRKSLTGVFNGWRIDASQRKLFSPEGKEVKLTAGEFDLLMALATSPNRVMTRERILDYLGEDTSEIFDRAIDTRVTRLRGKIEPDPRNPSYIKTERGIGYVFSCAVDWR